MCAKCSVRQRRNMNLVGDMDRDMQCGGEGTGTLEKERVGMFE